MTGEPLVQVIVLNYNGKGHLKYCLPSILSTKYSNFAVELIDNDSSDESVKYVQDNYPSVGVTVLDENRGWAGGNNRGIQIAKQSGAEYIIFANNDIIVHPSWIAAAVKAGEENSGAGIIGFDVYGTVSSVPIQKYETAVEEWDGVSYQKTTEFINGMALCVKSQVFDEIGIFDETFFMYGEETDFQLRAKKAGICRVRTNVPVWHYSSGTSMRTPVKTGYFAIRNHIKLGIKHDSVIGVLRRILQLYYAACIPSSDRDMSNRINQRRRPKGPVFNFLLVTYCLLWNLVNITETLRMKRAHDGFSTSSNRQLTQGDDK